MYLDTKTNLDDVTNAMLHEAANGYSVVFPGAIFESSFTKNFPESQVPGNLQFANPRNAAGLHCLASVKTADTMAKSGSSVEENGLMSGAKVLGKISSQSWRP